MMRNTVLLVFWLGLLALLLSIKKKEPASATHSTNTVERIPDEEWLAKIQAAFPETNSFAMVDTNEFPTLTFSSDDSVTGMYKPSSNVVSFAHSGRNVITLGKGYEQTEDPNEVTITFHGKDGSVWVPTWTKQ